MGGQVVSLKIGTVTPEGLIPGLEVRAIVTDPSIWTDGETVNKLDVTVLTSTAGVELVASPCVLSADQALQLATFLTRAAFLSVRGVSTANAKPCYCGRVVGIHFHPDGKVYVA